MKQSWDFPIAMQDFRDWVVQYIRNKDLIAKKVLNIKVSTRSVEVLHTDRNQVYLIEPSLTKVENLSVILPSTDKDLFLVTLNTKENIHLVAKQWDELSKRTDLRIIFVNPFSKGDMKWVLCPHIHAKISDRKNLLTGLLSLSEGIGHIDEATFSQSYTF